MSKAERSPLEKLLGSARSYKGHLTLKLDDLESLLELGEESPGARTSNLATQLGYALEKVLESHGKYENTLVDAIALLEEDEEIATLHGKLRDAQKDVRKGRERTLRLLEECGKPRPAFTSPPPAAAASAGTYARPDIAEALKPAPLSIDHTPVEFREWQDGFKAFYKASGLDAVSIEEQQAYFKACLDPTLRGRVRASIQQDTPIFGEEGSCTSILKEEFDRNWPILKRRLEFFRYDQSNGQSFTDWVAGLRARADEADLERMKLPEMFTMRLICGVSNKQLREKFLKEAEPTMDNLIRLGTANEVAKATIKAIDQPVSAATTTSGQKKNDSKPGEKFLNPAELKDKCTRCAAPSTSHKSSECPHIKATCTKCQKTGHIARACTGGAINKPKGQGKSGGKKPKPRSRKQSRAPSPTDKRPAEKKDDKPSAPTSTSAVYVRAASLPTPTI